MKKLILALVLGAIGSFGFAQRMEYVTVENAQDGRYIDATSDVKISGWVFEGKKTGTWIECHPGTELPHFIVQYVDGQFDGIYLEIDKQGGLVRQSEYKNGSLEGMSLKWARGGRTIEMVNYKNGLKDGASKICYDRGTVQEESSYKEGKRDGVTVWYAYAEKEQGPKVAMYTYKNGVFDGIQETYFENGMVKTIKMFIDNVQNGTAIEYYEDGSIKSESIYKKGVISGKVKEYSKGEKLPK